MLQKAWPKKGWLTKAKRSKACLGSIESSRGTNSLLRGCAQRVDQTHKILRRRSLEAEPLASNRMFEPQDRGVQRLAPERSQGASCALGQLRSLSLEAGAVDRIAQKGMAD